MVAILSSRQLPSPLAITELPLFQGLIFGNSALISPSSDCQEGSKSSEGDEGAPTPRLRLPLLSPSRLEASPSKLAAAVVSEPHEKKIVGVRETIETSKDDVDDSEAVVDVDDSVDRDTTRQLEAELAEKDRIIEECNAAKERLLAEKRLLESYTRRTMQKLTRKYQDALKSCQQDLQDANGRIREMERREASERAARNRDEVERWQNLSDKKDQELREMLDQKDEEIDNLRRELRELNEELDESTKQKDEEIVAANERTALLLQTNKELRESLDRSEQRLESTKTKLGLKTEHAYSLTSQNHSLRAENKSLTRSNQILIEGSRGAHAKMDQQARQSGKEIEKLQRDLQDHRREMRERRKEWDSADLQLATKRQELERVDRRFAKLSADKENLQEKYRNLKRAQRDASKSSTNLCVVCQDKSSRVAIVPCGHMCLCTSCSATYFTRQTSCPICRMPAQSTLKIYQ